MSVVHMSNHTSTEYPVVKAYIPGPKMLKKWPDLKFNWLVPCPFCERIHKHGTAPGPRSPHCPRASFYTECEFEGRQRPEHYYVVNGGEIDDVQLFDDAAKKCRAKQQAHVKARDDRRRAWLKAGYCPL